MKLWKIILHVLHDDEDMVTQARDVAVNATQGVVDVQKVEVTPAEPDPTPATPTSSSDSSPESSETSGE